MTMRTARLSVVVPALLAAASCLAGCGSEKKADADSTDKGKAAVAADGKPQITAVAGDFNFGKVKQGQAVEHTFKIKNTGGADLKIEKARGS